MNNKTLIRGESLSINVKLDYDGIPFSEIDHGEIIANAWFQNNVKVPLIVTQLEGDGEYNLYSDIDTRKLRGESFLVNIIVKNLEGDAPDDLVMATFNQTFYIVNSATDMDNRPLLAGGHSVVYLLDGEYYACENYNEGETIHLIEPIIESGYVFLGWSSAPLTMPDHCVVVMGKTSPNFSVGLLYEDIDENTCRCIGRGNCADAMLVIPPVHEGKTVTQIGRPAHAAFNQTLLGSFEDDRLISLYLPDTITLVGYRCFCECHSLSSIRFPQNSEFHVMDLAFYDTAIDVLTVPANMKAGDVYYTRGVGGEMVSRTENGSSIFGHCMYLTKVIFEQGFNFGYIKDLDGNIVPSNAVSLTGSHMFSTCNNLSEVSIPQSVNLIPQYLFYDCNSLTEIRFTAPVINDMEEVAFSGKQNLAMTHVYFACKNAPAVRYRVGESRSPVTFYYDGSGIGWEAFKTNIGRLSTTWNSQLTWIDISQQGG